MLFPGLDRGNADENPGEAGSRIPWGAGGGHLFTALPAAFSEAETAAMLAAIAAAKPDVLWVGMTAPKQEKWLHQHRDQLAVPFAAAVGAVFDFYAGNVRRSHPFFLRYHLEWLPRLLQEPRRLWRRNLVSTPLFLSWVAREKLMRVRA